MPHKFVIAPAANKQFMIRFVYNAEPLVWSENYKAKSSAQSCIESLKKNAPGAAVVDIKDGTEARGYRFEIAKSSDGQFFVRFVAANGETMVRSERYKSKASARNCIASLQKNGPGAPIEDQS